MLAYSALLTLALLLSSPWWIVRMLTTERYREGLWERLGRGSARLRPASLQCGPVVWVHAVSVGEVLAATRLVNELQAALKRGDAGACVVVSTTTRAGQALARERFGAARVFYMPLDFAWAVRRILRVLRPAMLVLMESELWPRLLYECGRAGTPVAVVNARVSDRSFRRGLRVRRIWSRVLREPSLWLAQSDEDARRLIAMGAGPDVVQVSGNLKYDIRAPRHSRLAELIRAAAAGRPIVVAGSTVDRLKQGTRSEDEMVLQAWEGSARRTANALLVLAPRQPERFAEVYSWAAAQTRSRTAPRTDSRTAPLAALRATAMLAGSAADGEASVSLPERAAGHPERPTPVEVIVLDTIGDLAGVYGVADVAFVGGSLVKRGGHNPLEPAQFGVPVLMGPSFENFREIVARLQVEDGIRIVRDTDDLQAALLHLLLDRPAARDLGQRAQRVFARQQGATERTVGLLLTLLKRPQGVSL